MLWNPELSDVIVDAIDLKEVIEIIDGSEDTLEDIKELLRVERIRSTLRRNGLSLKEPSKTSTSFFLILSRLFKFKNRQIFFTDLGNRFFLRLS